MKEKEMFLARIFKLMIEIKDSVSKLSPRDIDEIKGFCKPPQIVLGGVRLFLFVLKNEECDDWISMKKGLNDPSNIFHAMSDFDLNMATKEQIQIANQLRIFRFG